RANLDPDVASCLFPKVVSVHQAIELLLAAAESDLVRVLSRYSPTDRRPDCCTLGVYALDENLAVLGLAKQGSNASVILQDDHASTTIVGAFLQLDAVASHSRSVMAVKGLRALIHVIPTTHGMK